MATLAPSTKCARTKELVRIVIADGDTIFREALKRLLQAEADFHVIAEAKDGPGVATIVREARPHVVLLDLELPACSGLDALREVLHAWPPALPLLLIASIDAPLLIEALCLGARGVAFKTATRELLFKGIRALVAGEYWLERQHISLLISTLNDRLRAHEGGNHDNDLGLNQRELKLVAAIADGDSTRDIAKKFRLSEVTVRHHLTGVFRKLRVRNRGELVSFAMSHELRILENSPDGPGTRAKPGAATGLLTNSLCLRCPSDRCGQDPQMGTEALRQAGPRKEGSH